MKYAWIDGQRKAYPLPAMCTTLDVSISGYRAWKRGGSCNRKRLTNAQLLALIRTIHHELKGAYGSPRMMREVRARGPGEQGARRADHARERHPRAPQTAIQGDYRLEACVAGCAELAGPQLHAQRAESSVVG